MKQPRGTETRFYLVANTKKTTAEHCARLHTRGHVVCFMGEAYTEGKTGKIQ
jgi:hypothetical protein